MIFACDYRRHGDPRVGCVATVDVVRENTDVIKIGIESDGRGRDVYPQRIAKSVDALEMSIEEAIAFRSMLDAAIGDRR